MNWKQLGSTATEKILILNLWMNWENCLNLRSTVKNMIGNLHNIRPFTFHT